MEEAVVDVPKRTDIGWTDYVLKHFEDTEMVAGLPTADGLRRVAELLLGEVISSRPTSSYTFIDGNGKPVACVAWECSFKTKDGTIKTFGDTADVTSTNVEDAKFARFATAMAGTRAKGRAFKEALAIKVVSFEEMPTYQEAKELADKKRISDSQMSGLNVVCKRININVEKYVNCGTVKYKSIKDVPYDIALKMMKQIDVYQRDVAKIPDVIKGYEQNWKQNFGG